MSRITCERLETRDMVKVTLCQFQREAICLYATQTNIVTIHKKCYNPFQKNKIKILKNTTIRRHKKMSKKAYIFLADGFEDIEGLTVIRLLAAPNRHQNHIYQRNHPDPDIPRHHHAHRRHIR